MDHSPLPCKPLIVEYLSYNVSGRVLTITVTDSTFAIVWLPDSLIFLSNDEEPRLHMPHVLAWPYLFLSVISHE